MRSLAVEGSSAAAQIRVGRCAANIHIELRTARDFGLAAVPKPAAISDQLRAKSDPQWPPVAHLATKSLPRF